MRESVKRIYEARICDQRGNAAALCCHRPAELHASQAVHAALCSHDQAGSRRGLLGILRVSGRHEDEEAVEEGRGIWKEAGYQNRIRNRREVHHVEMVTIGDPSKGGKPFVFYKAVHVPATLKLYKYVCYPGYEEQMPDQFGTSFLTPSLGGFIASRKFYYGLPHQTRITRTLKTTQSSCYFFIKIGLKLVLIFNKKRYIKVIPFETNSIKKESNNFKLGSFCISFVVTFASILRTSSILVILSCNFFSLYTLFITVSTKNKF